MPKGVKTRKGKKGAKGRTARRTPEQVQAILDEVDALRKAGSTLTAALKQVGVPYSNYHYWVKRPTSRPAKAPRRVKQKQTTRGGIVNLLQEMTKNRTERQRLEKALRELDVRFNQLKKKLERG